jgi:hypothetical protein
VTDTTNLTYSEAKAAGARTYDAGKPCMYGHTAPRYTSSKACSQCAKDRVAARRADKALLSAEKAQRKARETALKEREADARAAANALPWTPLPPAPAEPAVAPEYPDPARPDSPDETAIEIPNAAGLNQTVEVDNGVEIYQINLPVLPHGGDTGKRLQRFIARLLAARSSEIVRVIDTATGQVIHVGEPDPTYDEAHPVAENAPRHGGRVQRSTEFLRKRRASKT